MSRNQAKRVLHTTLLGAAAVFGACTSQTSGYCETDADCPAGQRCNTAMNRCDPPEPDGGTDGPTRLDGAHDIDFDGTPRPDQGTKANGATCNTDAECDSGHCVDGVCCDGECAGSCRSCSLAGNAGTCSLTPAGQDPDADCKGTAAACDGTCDGFGQCQFPDSVTACAAPSCSAGELTLSTCDGSGGCSTSTQDCGGYACNSAGSACRTSCTTKADCTGAFECVGQVCTNPQPNGSSCGTNDQACQSGHCVEGVCCDSACTNPCASCAIGGKLGTCSPVADDTGCGPSTCTGSTKTDKLCKSGTCTSVSSSCDPFLCHPSQPACLVACGTDTDCVSSAYCDGSKVCQPRKPDGDSCADANECQSGICHVTEKVCCDEACTAGPCESCQVAGKVGTCSFLAAGTACNGGTVACVDDPATSYLTQLQCSGTSAACTATKTTSCDPYRCANAGACRSTCAAHGECSSAVCDSSALFGTQDTCIEQTQICYADATAAYPGGGTRSSPYAKLQLCLDNTAKGHIAAADGTYTENLQVQRQAALWATGTTGPLVQAGVSNPAVLKATIQAASGTVVTLTSTAKPKVLLHGFKITRPQAGSGLPPLIDVLGDAEVLLQSCEVTGNSGTCVKAAPAAASYPTLTLQDVSLAACQLAVDANQAHLVMRNCGIAWMPKGTAAIAHTGDPSMRPNLILEDVHVGFCGGTAPLGHGIHAVDSQVDIDRLRIGACLVGTGIELENYCQGTVTNVQISDAGVGLSTAFNVDPITVVNVTLANNAGPQLHCGSNTTTYNSILWKKNATADSWSGGCSFHYCQVQKAVASAVPGTNNASTDPLFATVDPANPMYRLTLGSPCRDQGTTTVPGITPFPTADLAGAKRVVNGKVDRGALEAQ